jgi:hypothetical protein
MYSLATDLYGLGIMKDPDAFKKPMLWLRFAKACKRCGRSADGLLAVKVSTVPVFAFSLCTYFYHAYLLYFSFSLFHSKR